VRCPLRSHLTGGGGCPPLCPLNSSVRFIFLLRVGFEPRPRMAWPVSGQISPSSGQECPQRPSPRTASAGTLDRTARPFLPDLGSVPVSM